VTYAPTSRVAARAGGHPALSRVIGIPTDEFAERHWGRAPLLSEAPALPAPFDDLFSADAVDELVAERGLRTPFLRVAKDGNTLAERAFTAPGGVGAAIGDQVSDDKLLNLFADGATIVLQGLHRTWEPLGRFSRDLAGDLGHPVQINAYVTPPQNKGFGDHYDVHDVFVLQVAGRKQWRVRTPVLEAPLRSQPWTDRRDAVTEAAGSTPLYETTLGPGDCLYLPRGYLHSATALGEVSIHLTVGVHVWTGYHLAEHLTDAALTTLAGQADVRRSLPAGLDRADVLEAADRVRAALHAAVDGIDDEAVLAAFRSAVKRAQRPEPVRPLAQLASAASATPRTVVRLRSALAPELLRRDGYAVLSTRAANLRLTQAEAASVEALLDAGLADVSDLGPELADRLLRQGVVLAD
jgi:ribosomal protein L16 Arg81 hydroxylase